MQGRQGFLAAQVVSELVSGDVGKGVRQHRARDGDRDKCGRGGLRESSIYFLAVGFLRINKKSAPPTAPVAIMPRIPAKPPETRGLSIPLMP